MTIQDQARALMLRHQNMIRNRENCMLSRAADTVGMPAEAAHMSHGQTSPNRQGYDRSHVGLS